MAKGMVKPPAEGPAQLKKPDFSGLTPANSASEPVVNFAGAENHGMCAGKWYGRAPVTVMDKQN